MKIKGSKKLILQCVVTIVFLALFAGLIYYANQGRPGYYKDAERGTWYETARILRIVENNTQPDEAIEGLLRGDMTMETEILTGPYAGETYTMINYFSGKYNVNVSEGEKISVRIDKEGDSFSVSVYNYHRQTFIIVILLLFFLALFLIGKKQGLMAILGLVFTFICIVFILIPLVLKGVPVLPVTLLIIAATTLLSFYLLGGIQNKTISAFLGTMAGVAVGALLVLIASKVAHINGFQMDDAESLFLIKAETNLHIKDLFVSGVLISAVGAIMDVAMTISSAVHEMRTVNPKIPKKSLFVSGMNIGRDAMGTMANTLILAFAGTSLNTMILIYSYGVTFRQLMNTDFIALEVLRAVAGSMGIIFTVPAVAYISAYIVTGIPQNAK